MAGSSVAAAILLARTSSPFLFPVFQRIKHRIPGRPIPPSATVYLPFTDSARLRQQLKRSAVRFGTDFILKGRSKDSINAEIFHDSIRSVFLPNLAFDYIGYVFRGSG
jgi:hypothetical protein